MAGPLDAQVGWGVESTYATPVARATFGEWDQDASTHHGEPNALQGSGLQPGSTAAPRAARRVAGVFQGSGVLALDAQSKGQGKLWQAAMGNATSTLVSGTTYQQLFTTSLTTAYLPSLTMQFGIVRSDASGTVDPYTYAGVTLTQFELACAANDLAKLKFTWDAAALSTATGLDTPTYPALLTPFHFRLGALTVGGSVVNPTTTALGSGGTAVNVVRDFTLSANSNASLDRWGFGSPGRNQPRVALRDMTIKMTAEYDSATIRDAILNQTTLPITLTFSDTSQALSTGFATLQIVAPAAIPQAADFPAPSANPVYDVTWDVLQPATGAALYIVARTSDSAL